MARKTLRTYENLSGYLDDTGSTQAELAGKLRKSQAYVSKLVNGLHQPPLHEALRIARLCRVPVESLVTRESVITEGK
jgi:transcriptional regulator with XRE-family HTH domain